MTDLQPDPIAIPSIRHATADDVPAIDQLLQGLARFLNEPDAYCKNPGALRRYGFGDTRLFDTMIAFADAAPLGLCLYFPEFSTWRGEPGVYIQDLYVAPEARGGGLGQRLIEATTDHAREAWNANYVRLSADHQNLKAIQFYERLGFVVDRANLVLKKIPQA